MDIVVIVIIVLGLITLTLKGFRGFIYYLIMMDILLRIVNVVSSIIPIEEVSAFLIKYFPVSLNNIVTMYTNDVFETVLLWGIVLVYFIFEYYLIKSFIKGK